MANRIVQVIIAARDLTANAFRSVQGGISRTTALARSAMGTMTGMLGSVGLVVGAGAGLKYLFDANVQLQNLQARLQTFTGSSAAARAVFEQLSKFAAKTPFELQDSVEAFIALRSAGIMPTEETMMRLGDQAAAFGGNIKDMAEAVRAATTGEMERLKQFGVVAKLEGDKIIASFNGQTQVIGRDTQSIITYLENLSKQNFAGSMERQAQTLGGQISNLVDNIFRLATGVGEGGASGAFSRLIGRFNEWIDRLNESPGEIRYWVNVVLSGLSAIIRTVWNLLTASVRLQMVFGHGFKGMALSAKVAFYAILESVGTMVNGILDTLDRIPGVEIDVRMRDFRPELDAATQALAENGQRIGGLVRGIGTDIGDVAEAWANFGRAVQADRTSTTTSVLGASAGGLASTGGATATGSGAGGGLSADQQKLLDRARQDLYAQAFNPLQRQEMPELRTGMAGALITPAPTFGGGRGGSFASSFEDTLADLGVPDTDWITSTDEMLGELAANGLAQVGLGFEELFEAIGGGEDVLNAFGKVLVKSVAQTAKVEGQAEVARGVAALAASIFPGTPGAGAAAGKHFASAALFFGVAGLAGSMGGGGGGAGGGGAGGALDDTEQLRERELPETTVVINGGILDMTDPRQAEAFENAFNRLKGQRRITVEAGPR